ncbi:MULTISPECIES: response regulator transcription factor [Pseudomonas]|jgi:DNA-binding CsgD family transcriptional regulator|uniref:Helix-turn-helix transcriptional regulator n=1 Tax=Pseudomonas synxantha TaxID=47883 RepID=A0A5D3GDU6_9PSED|nr:MULTISPECIES: helix-turn-helix transcriptional regulator [Pseudomonas]KFF46677.1 LuxR family transcriptional regulator [Pseudomonas sp. BRG-100]MBY8971205.1 helix-turn-helix transcriptional regulator [Pseudomonas sp. P867]MCK3827920.1 LuxR family transcriptional regulator [Pseudomonas sp. W2Aug9]MCK3833534.1 LuxR family transcriptional regulator [Pseudomonas fluorescens]MCK3837093.1 LuxR family transcriptional regulator [Pseudomonas sp. NCIMB 10586]
MSSPEQTCAPIDSVPTAIRKRLNLSGKPLTPTELEILRWASEGKTIWEISQIRGTSEAAVKFHLRNIYGKLDVTNRVQAKNEATRQGLC